MITALPFRLFIVITFVCLQSFGQTPTQFAPAELKGNEYFVGKFEGKPLIKVHLLSGVRSPGVYHVPTQTSLAEILAYAGGAEDQSDLDSISIRSSRGDVTETKTHDLNQLLLTSKELPVVREGDIIVLPNSSTKLGKTQVWVTMVSTIATVLLTVTLISQTKK